MKRHLWSVATSGLTFAVVASFGCAGGEQPVATTEAAQQLTAIGGALPGTDPERFEEALDTFATEEDIKDGLGPTFNENACGKCHSIPVIGGSGTQIERRFGRVSNGKFFGFDQAPDNQGGTLRQLFANGTFQNGETTCTIPLDAEPANATVHNVGRRSLPLFGLGLVDSMPDSWFEQIAASQPSGTRGTIIRAVPQFPDSRDPTQSLTATRVARFGIKNQQTNLVSFSGDAYLNEMGITTQSCFKGNSILAFAFENYPNNVSPPAGCNGGDLAPAQTTDGIPAETDDAVGDCTNKDEVQDDLGEFLFFMEHLAPPPQASLDVFSAIRGLFLFTVVGCADCHTTRAFTTPAQPFNGVPGNFTFFPFSDFLAHDMGSLGDRIGNTGDSVATTRLMRTAPLWGVRFNTQLLHDGRAKNVREAILFHDGQAFTSNVLFQFLLPSDQAALTKFVNAL